jgi:hypothetical protein
VLVFGRLVKLIPTNFNKLGILVRAAIIGLLNQPSYQVSYRKIIQQYQSGGGQILFFRAGKSKVQDNFPNVGFEISNRKDDWAATSFTKDIEISYDIIVAVKALQGPVREDNVDGSINFVEDYVITLSELILEILNEPIEALQYLITTEPDGTTPLPGGPIKIYDSRAEGIQYGFLYNGALRTAKISWFGKIMRTGPSTPGQTGY